MLRVMNTKIADAMILLDDVQQAFYEGLATKADLRDALDRLAAARAAAQPLDHNPPVKLK